MTKKVLLFFHNLNIEGAPTMLINAAQILIESGYAVEALSLEHGAYEAELKKLNIPTRILKSSVVISDVKFDQYIKRFDLIIANTVMTFSLIARYNNMLPIVWYIHEGKIIKSIFSKDIDILGFLIKTKAHIVVVSEYVKEWMEQEYGIQDIRVLQVLRVPQGRPAENLHPKLYKRHQSAQQHIHLPEKQKDCLHNYRL